jgi:uncharacterized protein (DUF1501 family)
MTRMQRRHLLRLGSGLTGAALLAAHAPGWAQAVGRRASGAADRILILVELKGGNDGLNTVVPYADPLYTQLRPTLAVPAGDVLRLDERTGLHPELKPLLAFWERKELVIVQGVGCLGPHRRDDVLGIRPSGPPEPEQRHRPWHRGPAFHRGRRGSRWPLRAGA